MKSIILGTAGHIDHGKTTLIKALTGTDTDRLIEEKRRGITIELGFAAFDLNEDTHVGVVDVPGHEKFVKNMVAGATGIDIVAMVIAADEGVMPQTREHLDICKLLGIRYGLTVLSKVDLVDEEWLELVKDDIRKEVEGTFLEEAPMVGVSSVTHEGVDTFKNALLKLSKKVPDRKTTGLFRLPVDRVFSMKGFGTVITGTLISGMASVGEEVMIFPSGITSKIRGIQVHNQSVESALAGHRTAINFQGLEKEIINRGDMISKPHALKKSYMIDISIDYLKGNKKPLKNRTQIRFHTGTSEILGIIVLLDQEEIPPGASGLAQLRLDAPVTQIKGDRFVLRSYSPVFTIAGGKILDPIPQKKHKRFKASIIEGLKSISGEDTDKDIHYHLKGAGYKGVSFADLMLTTNLSEKQLLKKMDLFLSKKEAILVDRETRIYIHAEAFNELITVIADSLENFHKNNPLKPGMLKEELKSRLIKGKHEKLFDLTLNAMIKQKKIVQEEKIIRHPLHEVALGIDQKALKASIVQIYRETNLMPPNYNDVAAKVGVGPKNMEDLFQHLIDDGVIIKIREGLFFYKEAITRLEDELVGYLKEKGEISTPEFKEMTGASRKYVIPLIEYFDTIHLTIRIGDIRKLRKQG